MSRAVIPMPARDQQLLGIISKSPTPLSGERIRGEMLRQWGVVMTWANFNATVRDLVNGLGHVKKKFVNGSALERQPHLVYSMTPKGRAALWEATYFSLRLASQGREVLALSEAERTALRRILERLKAEKENGRGEERFRGVAG